MAYAHDFCYDFSVVGFRFNIYDIEVRNSHTKMKIKYLNKNDIYVNNYYYNNNRIVNTLKLYQYLRN